MRAAQIVTLDGPSAVQVRDVPEPTGAVVVDVHAAGVSFPEVLQTRGLYQLKPKLPFIPGSEIAGVVRSAPDGTLRPGDRVVALPGVGGFAETVACDPVMVFPLPDALSFAQGAAMTTNYLTAHFALVRRARLEPGETVLVHGAAGGVGTAATQLAKVLGATVIAVVSTEDKEAAATEAGAHHVVLADGFLAATRELTDGKGVNVVVDPVGGDRFTDSLRSLAPEGRLLVIGFTGGDIPTVKVNRLLLSNVSVVGVGLGPFWMTVGMLSMQKQWADLVTFFETGGLTPVLGASFPLDRAGDALAELEERRATGKVTLTVRP